MARNRASMREGPLAELFRATEAAQRQAEQEGADPAAAQPEPAPEETKPQAKKAKATPPAKPVPPEEPQEMTVEHVPDFVAEAQREAEATALTPPPVTEPVARHRCRRPSPRRRRNRAASGPTSRRRPAS